MVVLDYGIAESLAFMKAAGIPWPADFIEATTRFAFRRVLVLDPISTNDADHGRIHAPAERDNLRDLIYWIYFALGHRPVKVPLMPVYERFNFIVNQGNR
jgi:predicted ATPase